jgi:pimeloyl-ACP methyl ester carboxylesterase
MAGATAVVDHPDRGGAAGAPVSAGSGGGGGASGATTVLQRGHGPGKVAELELDAADRQVQRGRFSFYVPDGVAKLNGIIVHQHGCGRSGITVPHDLHWQALANRWGMVLMGTEFPTLFPDGDHCERWSHIENGSDDLFIAALARFASDTQHHELMHVPWVLWGHSGGATWAFQMAKRYAAKVAVVVMKSICERDPAFEPALETVPFLLATGPDDLGSCYPITTEIFRAYRAQGAPWAYVDEPNGTHECLELRYLAIPYIDAMLEARLIGAPLNMLNAVQQHQGFLGEHGSLMVMPAASFSGEGSLSSWLPSASVGNAWRELVTTRSVTDPTAPTLTPTRLSYELEGEQARLRWFAEADLESGIASFDVYQDGAPWVSVPGSNRRFQGHNYGDEPEPVEPEMSVLVPRAHAYRVALRNGSGLESPHAEDLAIP